MLSFKKGFSPFQQRRIHIGSRGDQTLISTLHRRLRNNLKHKQAHISSMFKIIVATRLLGFGVPQHIF